MVTTETKEETITVKDEDGVAKQLTRREVVAALNERSRASRAAEPDPVDVRRKTMLRYPRLVAHLIAESLGYFCPGSAAMAIHQYKDSKPMFCEWYAHMSQWDEHGTKCPYKDRADEEARYIRIGRERLKYAVERRHGHKGYMSEYLQGRLVVHQELNGHGPKFASWF
jgi:hypothetical protein